MKNRIDKYYYSKNDIKKALKEIGLESGDSIFVHSNIGFFGALKGANLPEDYYRIFKDAIIEIIGAQGTLTVPTFSYSYCHGEIFDPKTTPGVGGFFSEMVRLDSKSIRSVDANFSIAAIGKRAKYFTDSPSEHSFSDNCFWERFLNSDGKFVNFNFDAASTFIHYVEKKLNVSYRYDKAFIGSSIIDGKKNSGFFYHFVYDLGKPTNDVDFTRFDKKAKKLGLAKVVNLGKGQIVSITARDAFDLIKSELKINPAFLIKGDRIV